MKGIEIVGEFDIDDPAEFPIQNHPFDDFRRRCIAIIVGDPHRAAAFFLGGLHAPDLLTVNHHRFFSNDITAGFQTGYDVVAMGHIRSHCNQDIRFGLLEHPVDGVGWIIRNVKALFFEKFFHALLIGIENAD